MQQSLRCRRRLRYDNPDSRSSPTRGQRVVLPTRTGCRQTLQDDDRLDSALPSLQNMGHRQTLHRRLRDDYRRESALSNLPDLGHHQTFGCPVRDVDLSDLRHPVGTNWDVVNHCFSVYEMVNLAKHRYPIYDSVSAAGLFVIVYETMNAIRLCHQVVNMIPMLCFCYHVKKSYMLTIKLVLGCY